MPDTAFKAIDLLSHCRAQVLAGAPLFRTNSGDLGLVAPHADWDLDAAAAALRTLQAEGLIRGFHPIRTASADAFLIER